MARRDGTGPLGMGPLTGRGWGPCVGGNLSYRPGLRYRLGRRLLFGRGAANGRRLIGGKRIRTW